MTKNKNKTNRHATETAAENATENVNVDDVLDVDNETEDIKEAAAGELDENLKLTQELDEVKAQLEKEKKEYLFLMADFDNYRKRVLKEKAELIKNGAEKAMAGILPIVDDFERGLESTRNDESGKAVREGMELIYQKFVKYLSDNGVKAMDTAPGSDFNTDFHDAITTIPAPTPELKGKIVDTTRKGYMINDKVLRHANVVVGE